MKGNLGIKCIELYGLDSLIDENFLNEELSNYYDDFFKLQMISREEPVILMGPSSYKTYLSEFYLKSTKFNTIYLNQKTTIEELLGGPLFLSSHSSKNFYYDLLFNIIQANNSDRNDLMDLNEQKIKNIKSKITNRKGIDEIVDNIIEKIEKNEKNNDNKPQIVFNPGSILLSILKDESIIFKNIHQVSTEVFERFNQLFGEERIISLNEDIFGTFFSDKNNNGEDKDKVIKVYKMKIQIIATCPENSFQSLSESVLSRFSVICVGEHEEKEKEMIIERYSKHCYCMTDYCLNSILDKIKNKEFQNIKKIKNLIDIFSYMNSTNIKNKDDDRQIKKNFNYLMKYIKYNNNNNQDYRDSQEPNIIILGDPGVGKFSIIKKYIEDNKGITIEKNENSKIELEIFNKKYNFYIFDDIEKFRLIKSRSICKVFLVYDITNKKSFDNLKKNGILN